MVKHIVTFKLKGTPEERLSYATDFKAALMALPAHVAAAAIISDVKAERACVDYEF